VAIRAAVGIKTLLGNIPEEALAAVYSEITLGKLAAAVGIIPFGLALYAAYREGVAHHIGIQATIALAISTILVLLFKAIPLNTGLAMFSIVCIALAAVGLQHMYNYSRSLKRSTLPNIIMGGLIILFLLTSVLSTIIAGVSATQDTVAEADVQAARWIKENTPKDTLVLAAPQKGHFIEAEAERKVYINTDYLGQPDAEERYDKVQTIYSSTRPGYAARAEHIEYIITEEEKTDTCLNTIYRNGTYIAKVLCR
jgi:hypothetical protein